MSQPGAQPQSSPAVSTDEPSSGPAAARLRPARARWAPGALAGSSLVLAGLLLVHIVVKVVVYWHVMDAPLRGDQSTYVRGANTFADLVRAAPSWTSEDIQELQKNVVGRGWFLPGMSLILMPLYLLVPDAGVPTMRAYVGVATFLMLLAVALLWKRVLGPVYAYLLVVFLTAIPMWVVFSFSAWGDPFAGLVAAALLGVLVHMARRLRNGDALRLRDGLLLGCLAIAALYLRSSALPLSVGVIVLALLGALLLASGAARRRSLLAGLLAAGVFATLLLPWSVLASKTLDGRVVTTTTVPLSLAVAFGDEDELCFGPCEPGNIWPVMVNFSREIARERGVSELVVQQEMSDHALRGLDASDYAAGVLANMGRYLLHPAGFADRFEVKLSPSDTSRAERAEARLWVPLTNWVYPVGLALLAAGLVMVVRGTFETRLVSVLLTLLTCALFVQPFVHQGSPRYWPIFAPMFGAAAALVWDRLREAGATAARDPELGTPAGGRTAEGALYWIQVLLVVGLAGLLVVLVALSR